MTGFLKKIFNQQPVETLNNSIFELFIAGLISFPTAHNQNDQ